MDLLHLSSMLPSKVFGQAVTCKCGEVCSTQPKFPDFLMFPTLPVILYRPALHDVCRHGCAGRREH